MVKHVLESIDPGVIGERLADARRARNLTQLEVAEFLGVARTTVAAMEKGERRARASELVRLAKLYGRSVRDMVQPETDPPAPTFLVQFRRAGQRQSSDSNHDVQTFEDLCRWYLELEELLDATLPRRYLSPYDISGSALERAAEEVATSERNRLGLGDGPIGDLWGLLETDVGLRVFAFPMEHSSIAGMFVYSDTYGGCIAVNAKHPPDRRRWSGCHEYAHFLTDRQRPEISVFRHRGKIPRSERFADAFAGYFLMPASGLTRRFESIRRSKQSPLTPADIVALSHLYRVSFQAMTRRLEDLKLLPSGTWELLKELGFKPNKARELVGLSVKEDKPSLPIRYRALAVQAYVNDKLTEGQLSERLLVSRVEARDMVNELTQESMQTDEGDWAQISLDLGAMLAGVS